jgi:hypothetical protein
MSLILEALKRSEAERHSGRDVAPLPPLGNAGRSPGRTSLWVAGAVAIGVGVAAGSWYLGKPAQPAAVNVQQPPSPGMAASMPSSDPTPLAPVVNHPPEDIEQTTDGPGISPGLVAAQPDPVVPEPGVEHDEQASNTPPASARPPDQPTEPQAVIDSPPPAAPVLVDLTTPPAALAPLPDPGTTSLFGTQRNRRSDSEHPCL